MTEQDDEFENIGSRGMAFTADQLWYLASAVQRGVNTTLHTAEDAFALLKAFKPNEEVARNDIGEPLAHDYGTQKETLRNMVMYQVQWLMETTSALDVGWKNEHAWLTLLGSAEDLHDRFYAWLADERKDRQLLAHVPEQEPFPGNPGNPETSEHLMQSVMGSAGLIAQRLGLALRESSSGFSDGRIHLQMSFEAGADSASGWDSEGT